MFAAQFSLGLTRIASVNLPVEITSPARSWLVRIVHEQFDQMAQRKEIAIEHKRSATASEIFGSKLTFHPDHSIKDKG